MVAAISGTTMTRGGIGTETTATTDAHATDGTAGETTEDAVVIEAIGVVAATEATD